MGGEAGHGAEADLEILSELTTAITCGQTKHAGDAGRQLPRKRVHIIRGCKHTDQIANAFAAVLSPKSGQAL